ncbi:MAG: hypothetical protein WC239_06075 [Sphaerochaetaceae bacterium]
MLKSININPRSYASIRKAVREGVVNNRGQLLREIHNAFRTSAKTHETHETHETQKDTPRQAEAETIVGVETVETVETVAVPTTEPTTRSTIKSTVTGRKDGAVK